MVGPDEDRRTTSTCLLPSRISSPSANFDGGTRKEAVRPCFARRTCGRIDGRRATRRALKRVHAHGISDVMFTGFTRYASVSPMLFEVLSGRRITILSPSGFHVVVPRDSRTQPSRGCAWCSAACAFCWQAPSLAARFGSFAIATMRVSSFKARRRRNGPVPSCHHLDGEQVGAFNGPNERRGMCSRPLGCFTRRGIRHLREGSSPHSHEAMNAVEGASFDIVPTVLSPVRYDLVV
jgi:hypothetical protein